MAPASGTAIQTRYGCDAYGVSQVTGTATTSTNTFQYTGRENDGTTAGLMCYRARYYNPSRGRFVAEGPIGIAGGVNLYAYVGQNPILRTDPTGLVNFLVGAGGSGVAGTGSEASAGTVFNPGWFGQQRASGVFHSVGVGVGFNVSYDFFVGFVKGCFDNVAGTTANVNFSWWIFSLTLFFDINNGWQGGTFGVGGGWPWPGASGSISSTGVLRTAH